MTVKRHPPKRSRKPPTEPIEIEQYEPPAGVRLHELAVKLTELAGRLHASTQTTELLRTQADLLRTEIDLIEVRIRREREAK